MVQNGIINPNDHQPLKMLFFSFLLYTRTKPIRNTEKGLQRPNKIFNEYKSTKHSTLKPQNGSTEEARRGAQVKTKECKIGREFEELH